MSDAVSRLEDYNSCNASVQISQHHDIREVPNIMISRTPRQTAGNRLLQRSPLRLIIRSILGIRWLSKAQLSYCLVSSTSLATASPWYLSGRRQNWEPRHSLCCSVWLQPISLPDSMLPFFISHINSSFTFSAPVRATTSCWSPLSLHPNGFPSTSPCFTLVWYPSNVSLPSSTRFTTSRG